jgi:YVTN family beta-propeller protein
MATEISKSQLVFSISMILISVILACVSPSHIDAQTYLHNQTLEAMVKQKVFHGSSQVDLGASPLKIALGETILVYVINSELTPGTVSVISTSNNTKVRDITVGKGPFDIAWGG